MNTTIESFSIKAIRILDITHPRLRLYSERSGQHQITEHPTTYPPNNIKVFHWLIHHFPHSCPWPRWFTIYILIQERKSKRIKREAKINKIIFCDQLCKKQIVLGGHGTICKTSCMYSIKSYPQKGLNWQSCLPF